MWQTHQIHLDFSFSTNSHHSYLFPLAIFGVGAGVFANGFWNYRKLRLIENTPQMAVRAIPMGFVHVHGKAAGPHLLTSPVTGTPCYYYHVQLRRWQDQGKNKGWQIVNTETERRTFCVDDGSGSVLINPQDAEFDLPITFRGEFGPHAKAGNYRDPSLGLAAGPAEADLRAYAAKADSSFTVGDKVIAQLNPQSASSSGLAEKIRERQQRVFDAENPMTGHGSYQVIERCVAAEHEYDVIGTCVANPQPQGAEDRNLIVKGQNEPTFVISGFSELNLEKVLRKRSLTQVVVGGVVMVITMGIIISELLSP